MTIIEKLKGALTALVTPFDAADAVDTAALARIVGAQIERGIDGLVACGTTGESPTLTAAEQERVVRTTVETTRGRVPVVAGTGTNSTKTTVEATKRAKAWGIDAALVVVPYYNKPTQEGLFRHYKQVFEETGVPIIAYNVPGRTVTDLLPETIGRLVECGAIVGVKDATANMRRTVETLDVVGARPFAMLSGDDFTILPFVALGGQGVISVVSNLAPGDTAKLVRDVAAGKVEASRALNTRLVALSASLFEVSSPIPIKAGMGLAGWCAPTVRLPLADADARTTKAVARAINAYRGQPEGAPIDGFMS
ncbi:MAG: 4-hydroxy-tetrahydrodipicolinate synthase [Deltaproteobacteria bacterium]|nr:4-hydroxy-tetrahydrodipicolinate synthase [Deltaproteobacteria bacterium]